MNIARLPGAPFDLVLDVGGNVGTFAELACETWPDARVVSFEPIPNAARANRTRARGRWQVIEVAISEYPDRLPLHFCVNQHSASTMQAPGTARLEHCGIEDRHETIMVEAQALDRYLGLLDVPGRHSRSVLLKVDVEGHEWHVLRGARRWLDTVHTVVCEVQQDATIFLGSPSPQLIDRQLRRHGLELCGIADAFLSPAGELLQFDGVWTRQHSPLPGA